MARSDAINVRSPVISTAYDELLTRKKRAIAMDQGTCGMLQVTLLREGYPINLEDLTIATEPDTNQNVGEQDWENFGWNDWDTFMFIEGPLIDPECSLSHSHESSCAIELPVVKVRWREASLIDKNLYQNEAVIFDAEKGIVRVEVPEQIYTKTGIYLVNFGIFEPGVDPDTDTDACPVWLYEVYLYVGHSAWHNPQQNPQVGPPTIDDVRLGLRDADPLMNELIDNFDFDLTEICFAAVRTVTFWNNQPPPILGATYSTKNFPFREIWLAGIHHYLFELAEEHYRRNKLQYSAGGVSLDDKAKARDYNQAWKERFQKFRSLVMHQKASINMSKCFSAFGAGYGYGYGYGRAGYGYRW